MTKVKKVQQKKNDEEKYEAALLYLDPILMLCPTHGKFKLVNILTKLSTDVQSKAIPFALYEEIKILMIMKFQYLKQSPIPNLVELTDKGRKAKLAGGHHQYFEIKEDEQHLTDKKDMYDLATSKWLYKTRYLPYILSAIAVIISLLAYFSKQH